MEFVDFGFTDPAARYQTDARTSDIPDAAALDYEKTKIEHYRQVPNLVESGRFVPIRNYRPPGAFRESVSGQVDLTRQDCRFLKQDCNHARPLLRACSFMLLVNDSKQGWMQEHVEVRVVMSR